MNWAESMTGYHFTSAGKKYWDLNQNCGCGNGDDGSERWGPGVPHEAHVHYLIFWIVRLSRKLTVDVTLKFHQTNRSAIKTIQMHPKMTLSASCPCIRASWLCHIQQNLGFSCRLWRSELPCLGGGCHVERNYGWLLGAESNAQLISRKTRSGWLSPATARELNSTSNCVSFGQHLKPQDEAQPAW